MSEVVYAHSVVARRRESAPRAGYDQPLIEIANLVIALLAVIFALPIMLGVGLAIFLQDGGSALFAHRRIGRDGKPFRCLKFRTMAVDAEVRLAEIVEVRHEQTPRKLGLKNSSGAEKFWLSADSDHIRGAGAVAVETRSGPGCSTWVA